MAPSPQNRIYIGIVWSARGAAGVAVVLLIASITVPWAKTRAGILEVTYGVPGIRSCIHGTDACCELDWEHAPALPFCLDSLLSAAANNTCHGEAYTCAQVRNVLRAQAGYRPGSRYPIKPERPELLPDMNWIVPSLAVALVVAQLGTGPAQMAMHAATIIFVLIVAAVSTSVIGSILTTVGPGLALMWTAAIVSILSFLSRLNHVI